MVRGLGANVGKYTLHCVYQTMMMMMMMMMMMEVQSKNIKSICAGSLLRHCEIVNLHHVGSPLMPTNSMIRFGSRKILHGHDVPKCFKLDNLKEDVSYVDVYLTIVIVIVVVVLSILYCY